jgi:hydrogenase nickel incorporation protein HypA/HybF
VLFAQFFHYSKGASKLVQEHALHEFSLTLNMIEIAEDHARRAGASAIKSISVKIGMLSGVIPDAIEFAFDACTRGTLAEGASLEIIEVPAIGRCGQCTEECRMESLLDACPECGSFALEILQGQEMALTEMEID